VVAGPLLQWPRLQEGDKIDYLADGGMVMHAGPMRVFVPRYFVQGVSEDGDAHVCAVSIAVDVDMPVCVFMPGLI
jgi:hypothetical protein